MHRFLRSLLLCAPLGFGLPALAQLNLGPITTPALNGTYYVGSVLYPTIQSAVTAACAKTNAQVVIPYGVSPTDTITAATGCPGVSIDDRRYYLDAFYTAASTAYSQPTPTVPSLIDYGQFLAFGGVSSYAGVSIQPTGTATSTSNSSSNFFAQSGNYWNGSASAVDTWLWSALLGSGTNPASTLNLTHSGSTGAASVQVPALTVLGLTNLSGGGTLTGTFGGNTYFSGNLTFSGGPVFSGSVGFGSGVSVYGAPIFQNTPYFVAQTLPSSGASMNGGGLGWNASAGSYETDVWNATIVGDTAGFYKNTASGYIRVARIDGTGTLFPAVGISLPHLTNNTGLQLATATGCTIATSAVGATCTTTITLPVAEADTSYYPQCSLLSPTANSIIGPVSSLTTTTFLVATESMTTSGSSGGGTVRCSIQHN